MTDRVFVDIQCADLRARSGCRLLKHDRAAHIVADLWEKENGDHQHAGAFHEFYVNVTRFKIARPMTPSAAARGIIPYEIRSCPWRVEPNEPSAVLLASEIGERNRISFWALPLRSLPHPARQRVRRRGKILSEDLNHPGKFIEGIRGHRGFDEILFLANC